MPLLPLADVLIGKLERGQLASTGKPAPAPKPAAAPPANGKKEKAAAKPAAEKKEKKEKPAAAAPAAGAAPSGGALSPEEEAFAKAHLVVGGTFGQRARLRLDWRGPGLQATQ